MASLSEIKTLLFRLQQQLWVFQQPVQAPGFTPVAPYVAGNVITGVGSPEGVVTAPIGVLYTNQSGGAATTLYVKTSGVGNTGWTAK
jgi:hypothetical protein